MGSGKLVAYGLPARAGVHGGEMETGSCRKTASRRPAMDSRQHGGKRTVTTSAALGYALATSVQMELGSTAGGAALGRAPAGEVKKR
jgi:hypothetical protein